MTPALPALGPILLGTVPVPDLAAATAAYTRSFGWVVQSEGTIAAGLAAAWGAPRAEGARFCIVGSEPGRSGGVRLVERPDVDIATSPQHVPGWRSLEICVQDVHEARRLVEGSPFTVLGEPAPLGADSPLWAMQVTGPGREMLYLTQTVLDSGFDLPLAQHPVDRMFIAVMTAPSLKAAAAWFKGAFATGIELPPDPYILIACSRDAGLPTDRSYRLTALGLAGQALVEIDEHFPEFLDARPPTDDLRPGIALITWEVESLDALGHVLRAAPVRRPEQPYNGRRSAIAVGAAGELHELVERG